MLPQDFVGRMKAMLGEEYEAFEASYEQRKYQSLRINSLKTDKEDFLENAPFPLSPIPWCENGYYYEAEDTSKDTTEDTAQDTSADSSADTSADTSADSTSDTSVQ